MYSDIVSFDDEKLILVDENDTVLGYKDKKECHLGEGVLHRAFSIFLFNEKGELLLQQRSPEKMLWGGFWSNTVCSHPRKGESTEIATVRRLKEELGINANLEYVYKFIYTARFGKIGSENENCHVFIGKLDGDVTPNPNEVADIKWIDSKKLTAELQNFPNFYTPWFKMEWQKLSTEYIDNLNNIGVLY